MKLLSAYLLSTKIFIIKITSVSLLAVFINNFQLYTLMTKVKQLLPIQSHSHIAYRTSIMSKV